jgi:hypothetical protein
VVVGEGFPVHIGHDKGLTGDARFNFDDFDVGAGGDVDGDVDGLGTVDVGFGVVVDHAEADTVGLVAKFCKGTGCLSHKKSPQKKSLDI